MTIHTAVFSATVGTLGWLWWRAQEGVNPVTMILRAVRWLAAGWHWRRVARAAWAEGADLFTALVRLNNEPERPIWPEPGTQTPCEICGHRRCRGCDEPARHIADSYRYAPRHDFSEVPPSIAWLAGVWSVTGRALLISRAVNPAWKPRPHQTGAAWRAWARHKLGRELLVGSFARPVGTVLP